VFRDLDDATARGARAHHPASHCGARSFDGADDVLGARVADDVIRCRRAVNRLSTPAVLRTVEGRVARAGHRPLSDAERAGGAHAPAAELESAFRSSPSLLRTEDDGLARCLRVEELVGVLSLLEPPAVREELLDVHVRSATNSAHSLALLGERPRPQGHLPRKRSGLTSSVTWRARRRSRPCPRAHCAYGRRRALQVAVG